MADFEKLSEEQAPKYPLGSFVEDSQRLEIHRPLLQSYRYRRPAVGRQGKNEEIRNTLRGGRRPGHHHAGALLVDIAVERENKFAIESPTYTAACAAARPRSTSSSPMEKIIFPHATAIDFFLCTDQRPYDIYKQSLKETPSCGRFPPGARARRYQALEGVPGAHHQRDNRSRRGTWWLTSVVSLAVTRK